MHRKANQPFRRIGVPVRSRPSAETCRQPTKSSVATGWQTVVERSAAVRNKLSDADGKGNKPVKPGAHHAELPVNLAGTMATFLVRTWESQEDDAA